MFRPLLFASLLTILLFFESRELKAQTLVELEGTTWVISYKLPGAKKISYEITFLDSGNMKHKHPDDFTPTNDHWVILEKTMTMYINDSSATFAGTINGGKITGTAVNRKGETWKWTAVRKR
ncbi:MAG: hypothetical protein KJS92_04930 [Bacteroidetes bacterium]|nr:hypothetical protein [Bacteroidota bacterium]